MSKFKIGDRVRSVCNGYCCSELSGTIMIVRDVSESGATIYTEGRFDGWYHGYIELVDDKPIKVMPLPLPG